MDIISVNNVSKVYQIYDKNSDRIKEAFHPMRKKYHRDFYALQDVSFSVQKGETVGIIGTNGSGKSTMLKIITGVLAPTEGSAQVNGKVSALLELGVGFDEDYTGLENIFIHASLLGFSKNQIEQKLDSILKFADIGDFINQPVKTYSSGMLVRLAFSIAINVDPEILIIDEALAVGDIFFQAKCFEKLEEIKKSGVTILFVSHDILSVKKLCSRVVWIENGLLREIGEANRVCEKYMAHKIEKLNQKNDLNDFGNDIGIEITGSEDKMTVPFLNRDSNMIVSGTGKAKILSAFFKNESGQATKSIETTRKCTFSMVVRFLEKIERPLFGFELENVKGARVYGVNNYMLGKELKPAITEGVYYIEFSLILPKIHSGEYLLTPAVASGIQERHVVHDRLHNFDTVLVENHGFDSALIELDAEFKIKHHDESDFEFINK